MESFIGVGKHGATSFVGADAVELYRATVLKNAIGMLTKGITPTRGLTMKRALGMATKYTGKGYKRTEAAQAMSDIQIWIEIMKSALPVIKNEE